MRLTLVLLERNYPKKFPWYVRTNRSYRFWGEIGTNPRYQEENLTTPHEKLIPKLPLVVRYKPLRVKSKRFDLQIDRTRANRLEVLVSIITVELYFPSNLKLIKIEQLIFRQTVLQKLSNMNEWK